MADAHLAPTAAGGARPLRFADAALRQGRPPRVPSPGVLRDLVGRSPAMQSLWAAVIRLAPHARATLVSGETGTGKSTVARTLHRLGPQRGGAFLMTTGAEEWGSSGASATVFLPGVDGLGLDAQASLARELADAAQAPVGEGLHVIAATDRDLRGAISEGRFRAELYYRLTVFAVHLPPLRERADDIPELAAAFLRDTCTRLSLPPKQFTAGATRLLQDLAWPGNLRELRNVVERASVLWEGDVLAEPAVRTALALGGSAVTVSGAPSAPSTRLDDAQHQHVRAALAAAGGNKTTAAAHLGVSRRALYRLIDRLERTASGRA